MIILITGGARSGKSTFAQSYDKKIGENILYIATAIPFDNGMGVVPSYNLGYIFRAIAGRINQFLAREADEVYITNSGIPLKLKG